MVPEAPLAETEHGSSAGGEGWFVLNARDANWNHAPGRGAYSNFEGEHEFPQVGVHLAALEPGEAMGMYHWEADQENFLILAGEALLLVEGQERPLRQWDFVHCPPHTKHIIIGAGSGVCLVLAAGAREHMDKPDSLGYPVDEVALRHGAGVEVETSSGAEAYANVTRRQPTSCWPSWIPDR